nr:metallopeptidase family protein [Cellulomonas flavigena]
MRRRLGTVHTPAAPPAPVRRRDRRGRGLRGLVVPMALPAYRTRAERFDDLVLDAVEDLERRWARQLDGAEFAVEDVPPSNPAPWEHGGVPLGRYFPADAGLPHRIVVYRRPVEARAADAADLADLVRDVVVEQVAHLLGLTPEDVDPDYGDGQ